MVPSADVFTRGMLETDTDDTTYEQVKDDIIQQGVRYSTDMLYVTDIIKTYYSKKNMLV